MNADRLQDMPFATVQRLTRDEGRAARMLGMTEDRCPYKGGDSRTQELKSDWLSGFRESA